MAVQEAQMWCDERSNSAELAQIVSGRQWFNCPVADILPRLQGRFDYGNGKIVEDSPHIMKFWKDHASYPYRSHELWFLVEGVRWGKFKADEDLNGAGREGQSRGPVARGRDRSSACRRRRSRSRRRAASRRSSTAKCSIRRIRQRIWRASRSSARADAMSSTARSLPHTHEAKVVAAERGSRRGRRER